MTHRFWSRCAGAGPLLALPLFAAAQTWVPDSPDTVILELTPSPELILPQRQDARARLDWASALLRDPSRAEDRRAMALMEQTLRPLRETHPQARLLYATLLQRRHDFAAALAELKAAEEAGLNDPNLFLQQAMLLRVQGAFDPAGRACAALATQPPAALNRLCQLPLDSLQGALAASLEQLQQLRVDPGSLLASWKASELADMLERSGQADMARQQWRRALFLRPADDYARAQLARNLLEAGALTETLALLSEVGSQPALRLLRLVALRGLGADGWRTEAEALKEELLRAARVHGERHDRELAELHLLLLDAPEAALEAARANWRYQREPIDLLLLARSAKAHADAQAASMVGDFVARHAYEDARLPALDAS